MSDWINWLVVAGVLVVLEIFSGTFYLLMITLGMLAGALVAFLGWSIEFQIITAALVGAIATVGLRCSRFGHVNKVHVSRDPNVNLDIGQSIQINKWQNVSAGIYSSRTMYRGAQWDVEYTGEDEPLPGMYKIIEVRGSQLIVGRGGK